MEVGWKEVLKEGKKKKLGEQRQIGINLTEYGEKHFGCCNQNVLTKYFPTMAILSTDMQIYPYVLP